MRVCVEEYPIWLRVGNAENFLTWKKRRVKEYSSWHFPVYENFSCSSETLVSEEKISSISCYAYSAFHLDCLGNNILVLPSPVISEMTETDLSRK